ncbi:winged helix-turn-helix domain-containing protein [Dietzia maris]|uniref:ArsR/SmtB family transcription factor n=1 Tax=Dietzia maris TaxID=37915 RepID=UPI00344B9749
MTETESTFPLSESAAGERAAVLTLLANPARLRLVTAMYLSPYSTVTQLAEDIGLSQNRVSSLLGSLRRARIVEHEMIGRAVHYRVSDEFACAVVAASLAND